MEEENLNENQFSNQLGSRFDEAETTTVPVTPEIVENQYKAPFNSTIGKSSIDLSTREANDKMLDEYSTWWKHGLSWGRVSEEAKPERDRMREEWYQKYHGMSFEEFTDAQKAQPKTSMYGHTADLQ